jgi:hypothetical protein
LATHELKELIEDWELRLKNFEDRPFIAKGMDERTALGCQHGRLVTLKQCLEELKTKIKES